MPGMAANMRESQIEPSAAELVEMLHCLRAVVTIFDADGRLVFASRHLNHLFRGLPRADTLVGQFYEDIIRLELPEIAPSALAFGTDAFIATRLAQLGPRAWAPCDIPLADGRIIEIKARRDEETGRAILIWNDVTAARHQFARLEQAITLSADAFAFFDSHDRFVAGNSLYAQLAGAALEQLRGQSFSDIIAKVAQSGSLALDSTPEDWIARRMRGHQSQSSADTLQTATGKAYLVRDHATKDGGRAVVFTDITEKTRAETALAQTQNQLADYRDKAQRQTGYLADLTSKLDSATAQADNAKTMLLRTMSHELKTPLNAILGFSDLMITLADNLSADQVREYAGLVHQGGGNLLKMLNQIMDLTKISAGRYDLRKETVDAGSMLWLAREAFVTQAATKNIAVDADACPIGLTLQADEAVLGGMINALLDNAIAFTHAGGKVKLGVTRGDNMITITVADNGPGVEAHDMTRILQPFEHAGKVADHAKGAGLGLTLVKSFADLHGGSLSIESTFGEGFAARLILPA